jgi:hypothetical protein
MYLVTTDDSIKQDGEHGHQSRCGQRDEKIREISANGFVHGNLFKANTIQN